MTLKVLYWKNKVLSTVTCGNIDVVNFNRNH